METSLEQADRKSGEITRLLSRWGEGDERARDRVVNLLYDEIRSLARGYMRRERRDHTLESTALVNEAFIRLLGCESTFESRTHFFRAAAQAMRRILVDHARRLRAGTRIPHQAKIELDAVLDRVAVRARDVVELDRALAELARLDASAAQVVDLRCFVGLSIAEVAALMGISARTVSREWSWAKAWLAKALAVE